jgi:hypothetical protein
VINGPEVVLILICQICLFFCSRQVRGRESKAAGNTGTRWQKFAVEDAQRQRSAAAERGIRPTERGIRPTQPGRGDPTASKGGADELRRLAVEIRTMTPEDECLYLRFA